MYSMVSYGAVSLFFVAMYARLETKKKMHGSSLVTERRLCHADEPSKGETAVHGGHCPRDMVVRMRRVMATPWVGYVCPLLLLVTRDPLSSRMSW